MDESVNDNWYRVSDFGVPEEGNRIHTSIEGRYITVFRQYGELSSIDSVCHHAGGPLTMGPLEDIEELAMTVVLCPWHKFMVSITDGIKVYKGVDFVNGKPVQSGWKTGKIVQRSYKVIENPSGVYVSLIINLNEPCSSDQDACNDHCGDQFPQHNVLPLSAININHK